MYNILLQKIQKLITNTGQRLGIDLEYYAKNGFWASISQVIQIAFGLLLSIVLARLTSEELLGQYNFLLSVLTIFSIASMPGTNISLIRAIAKNKHGTYKKMLLFSLLWSTTAMPLYLLVGAYFFFYDTQLIGIGIFCSALFTPLIFPFTKWESFYQGLQKFNLITFYNSIKSVSTTLFILAAVYFGRNNLILIFISYLTSHAITNVSFYLISLKYRKNTEIEPQWKESAYKLSLISIISLIYDHADKIIIGIVFEPKSLAIYTIASSIIIYFRTGIKILMRVILPKVFKAKPNLLRTILRKYRAKFFLILTLISAFLYFIFPYLIIFLYSNKYESSILYAQIYLISIPATGLSMFLQDYLIAFKQEGLLIKVQISLVILNLLLYIILIPILGIMGAIISSIIFYYLSAFIFLYFSEKQ